MEAVEGKERALECLECRVGVEVCARLSALQSECGLITELEHEQSGLG